MENATDDFMIASLKHTKTTMSILILREAILCSSAGSTMNIAISTTIAMTGAIPTMIGTTEEGTVGGTRGTSVAGMAIHDIMITTINVAVGIVRRAIMAKVPLISILGGDNDLPLQGTEPLPRRSNNGRS